MLEEVSTSDTLLPFLFPCQLSSWTVAVGGKVCKGSVLCSCVQSVGVGGEGEGGEKETTLQIKSDVVGVVRELMYSPGDIVQPGSVIVKIEKKCQHDIVVFDMCADCGLNLRNKPASTVSGSAPQSAAANIMAIHDNAGIRISQQEAEVLAYKDKLRLLKTRKLTLVVDLDQTLIHTSTDPHIEPGLPDVYGFRLAGQPIVYHCRLRPHVREFLEKVSKLYELHVFTMATKDYAAAVIDILDPEKLLFCDRIITRDEFFDPRSKALRFKAVFPCGDSMVAIIDDREDVWGRCPNLVHVKPYVFFSGTSDINAPPPLIPTSSSPSPPSASSLPSTPTTPRPFFSGAGQGSGVVPQGQPRPFKMRHISRQPRSRPSAARQPPSDLTTHGHSARGNGTSSDLPQQHQVSPVDSGQTELCEELSEASRDLKACENNVDGTDDPRSNNRELNHEQVNVNVNSNNNNSKERDGSDSGESSSDKEEDEGQSGGRDEGGGGGEESSGKMAGEGGKVVSSSSSSGSSSDSEDSCSSGSSSAMDESQPQQASLETVAEARTDSEAIVPDIRKLKNDSETVPVEVESADAEDKQKDKKRAVEIEDTDSFLVYLGDVLERIHSTFYTRLSEMMSGRDISAMSDIATPDLKTIIPEMRQSLLKGAKILFTGVIPTNIPPQRSPIWNTARAFGAVIHDKLVPGLGSTRARTAIRATTHVIAGKSGTAKLKEAKRATGVKIVSPRWLWSCAEQWKWLDERLFPVEADESGGGGGGKEGRKDTREKDSGDERKSKAVKRNQLPLADVSVVEPKSSSSTSSEVEVKGESSAEQLGRSHRLDSRISVSDEELERMEAEVDAEMGSSSSCSSGGEDSVLESQLETSLEQSYEESHNYEQSIDSGTAVLESRKRKHVEVDDSSSNSLNSEPRANSDSSSSSDDDDDALAALLAEDSSTLT